MLKFLIAAELIMAITYRPLKRIGIKNADSSESGEKYRSAIDRAVANCEKAFSKLEEYLQYDKISFWELSADVLNADKSFTTLKYHISRSDRSLEKFEYGNYIEHNLEELKRKVSVYEMLESTFGKVLTYGGLSLISGSLFGALTYSCTGNVGGGVGVGICSALIAIIPPATESFRRNFITYFIQRSHQPPIKNIITYSDLFFTDLREQLKTNE